jgi:hypothetical protein
MTPTNHGRRFGETPSFTIGASALATGVAVLFLWLDMETPILVVSIAGLLVGVLAYRAAHQAWGLFLAAICCAPACLLTIAGTWGNFFHDQNRDWDRAMARYEYAQGRVLGEYLAREYSGKSTVVVFPGTNAASREILQGLKEGLGIAVRIVGESPLQRGPKPQDPRELERWMYEPLFTWVVLDRLLAESPCDLIISLVGLPHASESDTAGTLSEWRKRKIPPVALLLDTGPVPSELLTSGAITALVASRPSPGGPAAADYRSAFDERFLLVTPKSFEKLPDPIRRTIAP